MARTLTSGSITDGIVGVLAVDDDNSTVGVWTTQGSSTKLTSGSGLTVSGVTLTDATYGTATTYKAMVTSATTAGVALTSPIAVSFANTSYVSMYAAVVDYDAVAGSTIGLVGHIGPDTASIGFGIGTVGAPGSTKLNSSVFDTPRNVGLTTLAADTKFGIGGVMQCLSAGGTNLLRLYYGAAGATGAEDTDTAYSPGNNTITGYSLQAFLNRGSLGNRNFAGKTMLVAVWNRQVSMAEFGTINADPMGTFFGAATTTKLKLLAHSSAASASSVAGAVFAAPTGGDITGAKIGEFTGKTFESSLESGQAVLKVPVADFGGSSLTTSDTPVALVRNTTNTTGMVSCTVIEE